MPEARDVVSLDPRFAKIEMSEEEFYSFSRFIESELGIKMPLIKKTMLEARLQKRLKARHLPSFSAYYDLVFGRGKDGSELICLIDAVTTNKTDFFREPAHFDYLASTAVPALLESEGAGKMRDLAVWSAGCSTGEEPYTIAMVLSELKLARPYFRFSIVGTDISSRVLEAAATAIYEEEKIQPIPPTLKKRYLLRSRDPAKGLVRISPELRSLVSFHRVNFMDERYGLEESMDIVFCRNVIIYFDRSVQEKLVRKLVRCLRSGGYLFMGHSETLMGMDLPLKAAAPTIYRKTG
jgi:chemotaxis protein methyltransferase CheR